MNKSSLGYLSIFVLILMFTAIIKFTLIDIDIHKKLILILMGFSIYFLLSNYAINLENKEFFIMIILLIIGFICGLLLQNKWYYGWIGTFIGCALYFIIENIYRKDILFYLIFFFLASMLLIPTSYLGYFIKTQ